MILSNKWKTKALISLRWCAGWSAPLLFANPWRQVFLRRGPYIFPYKGSLQMHMLTYTGEKPYKCEYCRKGFNQKGNLKSHQITHMSHMLPWLQYLPTSKSRQMYMFIHTEENPYKCEYCVKGCCRKGNSKSHQITHMSHILPWIPYLPTSKSRQMYLLIHTREKPYNCEYCRKGFNQKGNLNIPMITPMSHILPWIPY